MKLVAVIGLSIVLFAGLVFYCFQRRKITTRPGAFYLLVAAVACEALLVSALAIELAKYLRDSSKSAYAGTGDLMAYVEESPSGAQFAGRQSTSFPKPAVGNGAAWRAWQSELREFLIDEVYELNFSPDTLPVPNAEVQREQLDRGLIRRELLIQSPNGDAIPAVLLLPAAERQALPGIVVIHGHVLDGQSGLAQMVLPVKSYQQSAARELALAGFATLTIELRGFGMRGPPQFPDHKAVSFNAILAGGFYKKLVFSDLKRAVDLFLEQPEIDPERIGMTGVSLGGEIAVEFAALDQRIKAISFHSHGGRTGPYPTVTESGLNQPHYCHIIPGANRIMQREDPFLLLAPRPTQGLRGEQEPFAEAEFRSSLQHLWALLGMTDALELKVIKDSGHTYFVEDSIRFFKKAL